MKTAGFVLNGICMETRLDARKCEEGLKQSGWKIVRGVKGADIIFVYMCGVVEGKAEDSIRALKRVQAQKRDDQELIVCGCLPKIDMKRLRQVFDGPCFGPREMDQLAERLGIRIDLDSTDYNILRREERWYFYERFFLGVFRSARQFFRKYLRINLLPGFRVPDLVPAEDAFYIQPCIGCLSNCAFCVIRRAKGVLKSKTIPQIMEEFERGLKSGYRRFFLCGDDLGVYGRDIGTDLAALLEEMINRDAGIELNLREMSPDSVFRLLPKLKPLFKTEKIRSVAIPVQSGSDKILKLMNRKHTVEQSACCITQLREAFPPLLVGTTVMVGFPGETEEDFRATLDLLDKFRFDMVDIANYSNRPGTVASTLPGQVDEKTRRRRARAIERKSLRNLCLGYSA